MEFNSASVSFAHDDMFRLIRQRYSQIWFWYRCQFPKWRDWNIRYTKKGLVKLILTQGLKAVVLAGLIALIYVKSKQPNFGVRRLRQQLRLWRAVLAGSAISLLERLKDGIENLM
jgi:hypothetical protein